MCPDILIIGPLTVHSFGLMAMLAFLVPMLILRREFRYHHIDPNLASTITVAAMIGGLTGARIYYIIEHWHRFLQKPFAFIFGCTGLVWYGGLIGGVITVAWVIQHYKMPFLKTVDLIAPLLLLGYSFGRVGCFLSGDGCYGPPSDLPWAMAFPKGIVPTNIPVHPTPVYAIIICMIFFAILWSIRHRKFISGTMFGLYLISAGIDRFIVEFWRNTPKLAFGWMSLAQMISIILVLAGLLIISSVSSHHKHKK